MSGPTVVLTGCNSGIGHAWATILIREGYAVWATDAVAGEPLQSLSTHTNCTTARLDVTDLDSISTFKKTFGDRPLHILLHIAGVLPKQASDTLLTVSTAVLEKTYAVNAIGPILLTQSLLPNILAAKTETSPPGKIGIITSRVGSIGDNTSGGSYAYRSSKAAAKSLFRSAAMDLKEQGVAVVLMHPRFVKSGLDPGIWEMKEAVMPEEAAGKLWGVFGEKTVWETGRFWHREGFELPW